MQISLCRVITWRVQDFYFFQIVCNADLTISHVDARHPGSANDAHVLRMSPISVLGEEGAYGGYVLIGDSGSVLHFN